MYRGPRDSTRYVDRSIARARNAQIFAKESARHRRDKIAAPPSCHVERSILYADRRRSVARLLLPQCLVHFRPEVVSVPSARVEQNKSSARKTDREREREGGGRGELLYIIFRISTIYPLYVHIFVYMLCILYRIVHHQVSQLLYFTFRIHYSVSTSRRVTNVSAESDLPGGYYYFSVFLQLGATIG